MGIITKVRKKDVKWSLEILPKYAENINSIPDWLEEIYITMIPGDEAVEVVEASNHVKTYGKIPIPHIAARGLESKNQFKMILGELEKVGVEKLLLIGGGVNEVQGPFKGVMDLLESGEFDSQRFSELGIAGHPDGNPDDPDAQKNLLLKTRWGTENNISIRIVTQWSFDTERINDWIRGLRELGVENPIHLGIPGPASLKTLLRYAKVCGVKASSTVLKKQGLNLGKLLFVNNPDKMIEKLEGYQQLHLFPFGGVGKSSEWLKNLKD